MREARRGQARTRVGAGLLGVMFVYATAADAAEARRIGRAVVAARLAACANILPGMRSVYWWQGKLEEGREAVLILKTTEERLEALVARVKELIPMTVPASRRCRWSADTRPISTGWRRKRRGALRARATDCPMAADMAASQRNQRRTIL